jgi:hypothetical protein
MTLGELDGVALTASQGFRAMGKFLFAYFDRTDGRGLLATIVGDVELERDGSSTDPAALSDWVDSVNAVLAEDDSADRCRDRGSDGAEQ